MEKKEENAIFSWVVQLPADCEVLSSRSLAHIQLASSLCLRETRTLPFPIVSRELIFMIYTDTSAIKRVAWRNASGSGRERELEKKASAHRGPPARGGE